MANQDFVLTNECVVRVYVYSRKNLQIIQQQLPDTLYVA